MPSHTDYTNRREAYCAWLTANRINPADVLRDADVYLDTAPDGSQVIVYEGCVLDSDGRRQLDERANRVSTERRTTPLLVAPPPWWEPYRKPTRGHLLEAVARVHTLHVRNENSDVCEYCSARDYPDYDVPWPCETVQALTGI